MPMPVRLFALTVLCAVYLLPVDAQQGPSPVTSPKESPESLVQRAEDALRTAQEAADDAKQALEAALAARKASEKPEAPASQEIQDALDEALPALRLRKLEHFGRSVNFAVAITQQPSEVLIGDTLKDTPQGYLTKATAIFNAAEFFTTAEDVAAQVKVFTDEHAVYKRQKGWICDEDDAVKMARCLVRSRARDILFRGLSGITASGSFSENLRVRNDASIPAGSAAARHNNQITGSVTFSPVSLVLNGSDWANAQKAAVFFRSNLDKDGSPSTTVSRELFRLMIDRCERRTGKTILTLSGVDTKALFNSECVKRIAGPYGIHAWIASGFPDVTYQVQSQFDFVKSGIAFVADLRLQPTLWTVSAKWDMSRWLVPSKQRIAAIGALIAALKQDQKDTKTLGTLVVTPQAACHTWRCP